MRPKRRASLKYNCKDCNFHWEGWMDTFDKVLAHEKIHVKNKRAYSVGVAQ